MRSRINNRTRTGYTVELRYARVAKLRCTKPTGHRRHENARLDKYYVTGLKVNASRSRRIGRWMATRSNLTLKHVTRQRSPTAQMLVTWLRRLSGDPRCHAHPPNDRHAHPSNVRHAHSSLRIPINRVFVPSYNVSGESRIRRSEDVARVIKRWVMRNGGLPVRYAIRGLNLFESGGQGRYVFCDPGTHVGAAVYAILRDIDVHFITMTFACVCLCRGNKKMSTVQFIYG